MADCKYCNRPAGAGSDFHVECKAAAEAALNRISNAETERLLYWLEPAIRRAVFRGVLLASLVMTGICLVLSVLYYALSHS